MEETGLLCAFFAFLLFFVFSGSFWGEGDVVIPPLHIPPKV